MDDDGNFCLMFLEGQFYVNLQIYFQFGNSISELFMDVVEK
jgi:hypothetical protein